MEIEVYLQGHKFKANSIEEVDRILKWFKPWKCDAFEGIPKSERGIPIEAWRRNRLRRWGII